MFELKIFIRISSSYRQNRYTWFTNSCSQRCPSIGVETIKVIDEIKTKKHIFIYVNMYSYFLINYCTQKGKSNFVKTFFLTWTRTKSVNLWKWYMQKCPGWITGSSCHTLKWSLTLVWPSKTIRLQPSEENVSRVPLSSYTEVQDLTISLNTHIMFCDPFCSCFWL